MAWLSRPPSWPKSRYREMDNRKLISGTYYWSVTGSTVTATGQFGDYRKCDDVEDGWGYDNNFQLVIDDRKFPVLDGEQRNSSGTLVRKFEGYPLDFRPSPPSVTAYYPIPTLAELDAIWLHAQAVTNPSAASVSIPTFIGELRDLPMLVKDWGGTLLRKVAKGNITWRFAVKPMISDLRKLWDFTQVVEKRLDYLKRLGTRKWVRRRVNLRSENTTLAATTQTVIHSNGASIRAYRDIVYSIEEWCTLRYKLYGSLPENQADLRDFADRLVRGETSYEALKTAWELTPWSWFTDWFYGIGDFLAAHQNTVPVIASGFCYMRHIVAKTVYRGITKPDWVTLSGPHEERHEVKLRMVPAVDPFSLPTLSIPTITGGQWSILGSLAALKSMRTRF